MLLWSCRINTVSCKNNTLYKSDNVMSSKSYIGLNNKLDITTTTQKQNNLISRKGGNTVYFVNFKFLCVLH